MLNPPASGCERELPCETWPSEVSLYRSSASGDSPAGGRDRTESWAGDSSRARRDAPGTPTRGDTAARSRSGVLEDGRAATTLRPTVLACVQMLHTAKRVRRPARGSKGGGGSSPKRLRQQSVSDEPGPQRSTPQPTSGVPGPHSSIRLCADQSMLEDTDYEDDNRAVDRNTPPGEEDLSLAPRETLFDSLFARVRTALSGDTSVKTVEQRTTLRLVEKNGLLWRNHQLYIPSDVDLRHDLLYWHHDVPWCAHLGIAKTVQLVKRQFYWPGMDDDIKDYVRTCQQCQVNKTDRQSRRIPLTPLATPDACWRVLGVDLIVDLPPSQGGFDAICVFVCHLSKMVIVIPTHSSLTTEGFVELFFREIFPHYGFPSAIVSDRGRQWNSEFFQSICKYAGAQRMSTAYHPQTNGLTERYNEVVAAALRHFVGPDQSDWSRFTPFVEFALNDSYVESIGGTPFSLNRITRPRNPFDAIVCNPDGTSRVRSELASWLGTSQVNESAGARTVAQAHEALARAKYCVHLAKCRMKERHDRQGTATHLYAPGQLVWFNVKNIGVRHPSQRRKLQPKYVGPVKILEVLGQNAVRLEMPAAFKDIHPTVSVSLVKPYWRRADASHIPVIIDDKPEWEIHDIADHNLLKSRKKGGLNLVEFKVRWKGNAEDSWHELSDFENSMQSVEKYLKTRCTKATRLRIYSVLKPKELLQFSPGLQAEAKSKPQLVG